MNDEEVNKKRTVLALTLFYLWCAIAGAIVGLFSYPGETNEAVRALGLLVYVLFGSGATILAANVMVFIVVVGEIVLDWMKGGDS